MPFLEKNFTVSAIVKGNKVGFTVIPLFKGYKRVFRIVSENIPDLIIGLNEFDSWDAVSGTFSIYKGLLEELGEKIDIYLLEHPELKS